MRRALGRNRRDLGRPEVSRLHRHATVGRGVRAKRNAMLARPLGRYCELERRSDALANRELAIAVQRSRPSRIGHACVGRRAVPGARNAAGPMETYA